MTELSDLTLSGPTWVDLQAVMAGDLVPSGAPDRLEDLNLVASGVLTVDGAHLLEGYLSATAATRVRTGSPDGNRELTAWMGDGRVGMLDLTVGEEVHLSRTEPGMFPLRLAALLGLGPRPMPALLAPQEFAGTGVLDLLDGDDTVLPALVGDLRPIWPEVCAAHDSGAWQWWTVESFSVGDGGMTPRGAVAVLDTAGGMLGIDPDADRSTFSPLSTTDVWIGLSDLLAPWT